jgi:hypothetical protein
MGRGWVAVSVVLTAGSLAVAGWALEEAREAREEARSVAQPGGVTAARVEAAENRLARIEEALPSRGPSVPGVRGGVDAGAGVPPGATPGTPATATPGEPGPPLVLPPPGSPERKAAEERLLGFIRQAVHEELEARKREGAGQPAAEKKPPLSQFAAQLELDDSQREIVHRAVVSGQEEVIGILRTATAGGRVPLDDILKAFTEKPEENRDRVMEVFGMLATEKVPGSAETYAQRMDAVKKSTAETFRRSFTQDQFKAYEKMGQDPLEIQVEDSPWIEIFKETWGRRK